MEDLLTILGSIFDFLLDQFSQVFSVITSNPILYLPVLVALFGSIAFYAVKIIKRMGVRGKRG